MSFHICKSISYREQKGTIFLSFFYLLKSMQRYEKFLNYANFRVQKLQKTSFFLAYVKKKLYLCDRKGYETDESS